MPERLYGVDYDHHDMPEMKSARIIRETAKLYHLSKDDTRKAGDIFGWKTQIHKEDKEAQITTPEEAIRVARESLENGVKYAQRGLRQAVEKLNKFDDWAYKQDFVKVKTNKEDSEDGNEGS